ncbi:glycosyltransferase family 39 protein [bacterium]|nr:glycosyltransferase family 39 protein [bacterium]
MFIFFLVICGIFFKLFALNLGLFDDDGVWACLFKTHGSFFLNFTIPHPPFGVWFYQLSLFLFGETPAALRIVPIVCSLILMFLIYRFLAKNFDKKTGIISLVLMLFTFFPYQASLIIDLDNSFLPVLLFVLFERAYSRYVLREDKKIIIDGVILGLAWLTKLQTLLFVAPIFFFQLVITRDIKKSIKDIIVICCIAGSVFLLLFPFLVYLAYPGQWYELVNRIIGYAGKPTPTDISFAGFVKKMVSFKDLFAVITPLYLGCSLLAVFKNKEKQAPVLFWFIPLVVLYMCLVSIEMNMAYIRYFSIFIPFFVLLTAIYINTLDIKFKKGMIILLSGIVVAIVLLVINNNLIYKDGASIYSLSPAACSPLQFLSSILYKVIFAFGMLLLVLIVVFYFFKMKKIKSAFIPFFLISMLGHNLFLMGNLLYQKQLLLKPINEIKEYYQKSDKTKSVFCWNEEIPYYLNIKESYDLDGFSRDPDKLKLLLSQKGGYIFLYPSFPYEHSPEVFDIIRSNSSLIKQIYYKNKLLGEIYETS